MTAKTTRGGVRKGAGRKTDNPLTERLNMRVDIATRRTLERLGYGNMQAGLRELIRRHGD
jgi:hypothetical protein